MSLRSDARRRALACLRMDRRGRNFVHLEQVADTDDLNELQLTREPENYVAMTAAASPGPAGPCSRCSGGGGSVHRETVTVMWC